jgi:hypothetical protein
METLTEKQFLEETGFLKSEKKLRNSHEITWTFRNQVS